jgi:hypothetical protein
MISHHCATSYFVFKFLGGSQRQNWLQSVLWPTVGSHRLKTKPKRIAGGTVVPKGSNPPKEGSLDVISRVFPNNFQHFNFRFRLLHALHIQNLSNCYRRKYVWSVNFTNFSIFFFGGFLPLGQTVRNGGGSNWPHEGRGGRDSGQNCESEFCRNDKKWTSKEVRTV